MVAVRILYTLIHSTFTHLSLYCVGQGRAGQDMDLCWCRRLCVAAVRSDRVCPVHTLCTGSLLLAGGHPEHY